MGRVEGNEENRVALREVDVQIDVIEENEWCE